LERLGWDKRTSLFVFSVFDEEVKVFDQECGDDVSDGEVQHVEVGPPDHSVIKPSLPVKIKLECLSLKSFFVECLWRSLLFEHKVAF
jgi:hypothetical protein